MKKILLIGGTGLVGGALYQALKPDYRIVITAGHHEVPDGYHLPASDRDKLIWILDREKPDIVISAIRGDFKEQMEFHRTLALWLSENEKRLLFLSTANVFDGDMSKPHTEQDLPVPASDYGMYKRNCEIMLQEKLPGRLIIFRLPAVWAFDCPRLHRLEETSHTEEPLISYPDIIVNIALTEQIQQYARYVLRQNLTGIFHIGTSDMTDYFEFEKTVCKTLGIPLPEFQLVSEKKISYQAVLSERRDIPENLKMTLSEALQLLKNKNS